MKAKKARIMNDGMGGFLCPPGHPMHSQSIDYGEGGCMCLETAEHAEWLDKSVRDEAARILSAWKPMPLESAEVQTWISSVLRYFKGCYRNPDVEGEAQWHAANLLTRNSSISARGTYIRDRNPLEWIEDHAGVRLIRKYYPNFYPTREHFDNAK